MKFSIDRSKVFLIIRILRRSFRRFIVTKKKRKRKRKHFFLSLRHQLRLNTYFSIFLFFINSSSISYWPNTTVRSSYSSFSTPLQILIKIHHDDHKILTFRFNLLYVFFLSSFFYIFHSNKKSKSVTG